MKKIHSTTFTHNGKTFEIAVFQTETGYLVKIFMDGKPVGPNYTVSYETVTDFETSDMSIFNPSLVEMLIEMAKDWIRTHY